ADEEEPVVDVGGPRDEAPAPEAQDPQQDEDTRPRTRALRAPESKKNPQNPFARMPRHYLALAAIAVLGLAAFLWLGGRDKGAPADDAANDVAEESPQPLIDEDGQKVEVAALGKHRNDNAGVEVLTLDDGSVVKLATGAEIDITGSRALIVVSGKVVFDVQRDPDNPFVVEVPDGNVEVLGTRFLVDVDDGLTRT